MSTESTDDKAIRCGLIGRKLGHSYSQLIHGELEGYDYFLQELEPGEVTGFLKAGDFHGLNVTIPYKRVAMEACELLTPEAKLACAVNTIRREPDGRLCGHNTDIGGFRKMCGDVGVVLHGRKVLVLGSGGAGGMVRAVALADGAREVVTVSRQGPVDYGNVADLHGDAEVLVNATPCGMFPDNGGIPPIGLERFPRLAGVLDLVYNPARTMLCQRAKALGIPWGSGLTMLVEQARLAAEFWLEKHIPSDIVPRIVSKIRHHTMNVVLVGMPGCGKSSLGKMVSRWTGREFVDTDKLIARDAGKSIARIFAEDGEVSFRERECRVIEEQARRSGIVLATGGGSILSEQNRRFLRANGIVFWLQRPLEELSLKGRPLSRGLEALEKMERERRSFYEDVADIPIENRWDIPIGAVARRIIQLCNDFPEI